MSKDEEEKTNEQREGRGGNERKEGKPKNDWS